MIQSPYLYDIEVFPNFFCVTFLSAKTNECKVFIIDDNKKQHLEIAEFAKSKWLIGYNSEAYDNIILNYIIKNPYCTNGDIYTLSKRIFKSQGKNVAPSLFYEMFRELLKNNSYKSTDLMRMHFSKKLRVGLKELECSLNYHNVQELQIDFDLPVDETQKIDIIDYNINDVRATKVLLKKSTSDIKLRIALEKEFNIDTFSKDGVNIGKALLALFIEKETGNRDFLSQNEAISTLKVKDIIYPIVKFKTKRFNDILEQYNNLILDTSNLDEDDDEDFGQKKFKLNVLIEDNIYKLGLGGIHSEGNNKNKIWKTDKNYKIYTSDVESYYPSQFIEWEIYPHHLKKSLSKVAPTLKKERVIAKKNKNKVKDITYKLLLNAMFGLYGNKWHWLYAPRCKYTITINGQLMLLMAIEELILKGFRIIEANTDGLVVEVPVEKEEEYIEIWDNWEKMTRMKMDHGTYDYIYFQTTSDYFGMDTKKQELKCKGAYLIEPRIGKGMEFPIIQMAVMEYFLKGRDYVNFIKSHENILDFCSYKKLKKEFECYWKDKKQQRINRFYACKRGAYLYRRKYNEKKNKYQTDHLLKDSPVQLLNKIEEMPMKERWINYNFYIKKIRDIIYGFEKEKLQTSLF